MLALRIHVRILERSKTANIAETTQPLAKHVPNVPKNHLAKVCRSTTKHSNEKPKKKSKDEHE